MCISNSRGVSHMVLQFSCSNHKSIRKKVTFSAIAGSDNTFEETLKPFSNVRVMRSAVIYGANGSGKSNFISALEFMRDLVSESIKHQPGQGIFQAPHKLNSDSVPSEYDIQFVKNDIRYAYGFSIVKNVVQNEYLYYFLLNGKSGFKKLSQASSQPNLNKQIVQSIQVQLPSVKEQKAIVNILSQADKEIELLQKDLEEEKNKKKALMQLLLTGIVRVV